jgi:ferrous iron transport protein B
MSEAVNIRSTGRIVALIGNPNSGKTTLFNALTGLHHKVGNYPGVTVEKKEGKVALAGGGTFTLLDLPGSYSLHAQSPDERVTTDVLLGRTPHTVPPQVIVCAVDATNLERNLYLVTQVIDRHLPMVIALTMSDLAREQGICIDARTLSRLMGCPVVPVVAQKGEGLDALRHAIISISLTDGHRPPWTGPEALEREQERLRDHLRSASGLPLPLASHEAIELLTSPDALAAHDDRYDPELAPLLRSAIAKLDYLGIDRQSVFVESRYAWIRSVLMAAVASPETVQNRLTDRIDRVVTHRFWGFLIFLLVMATMFQSIFTWAAIPMAWIASAFDALSAAVTAAMPAGELRELIVHGAIAGVAGVVTFLPQIVFLFFFLGLLEDSGYMARAAFIMDKLMSKVGLHGKSFIPLLGSFACAIPGIMATRTIDNPKDRLATILVAPLMSCSARLPVYSLLIGAFIPATSVLGIVSIQGMTLLSLYLFGMVMALTMAWVFKKTFLRGAPPLFIMELPAYRMPSLRTVLYQVWERSLAFLKTAGTIILGVSILLWALTSYPRIEKDAPRSSQLAHSYAGRAGKAIEPLIRPLGFDWKIGIGLISSLMQREAFVSAMATIYDVRDPELTGEGRTVYNAMREDRNPSTGAPTFSLLTAVSLMIYYVLAMQCLSTVAIVRRETNGWKWPIVQIGYMTALAYGVTLLVHQGGLMLGLGG